MYQKIGLKLFFIFFCAVYIGCGKEVKTPSTVSKETASLSFSRKLPLDQKWIGKFRVEDKGAYLLLHGFKESSTGKPIPLFWDTSSKISFFSGIQGFDLPSSDPLRFIWSGNHYSFAVKKGIIPDEIPGIVGLDFFRETCVLWQGEDLYVFESSSGFCEKPQAYFSTSLKILASKTLEDFPAVGFRFLGKHYKYGLLDTGSSFSNLPNEMQEKSEFLRKEIVVQEGNLRKEADLFRTQESLGLATTSGVFLEYSDIRFLSGISLENFLLPREKDRGDVWVIGLDILRRRPLFWDFSRNRIGVLVP